MSQQNEELHSLELKIGKLLRKGVLSAGVVLIFGWIGMILQDQHTLLDYGVYKTQGVFEEIEWAYLTKDIPLLVAYAGLLILISLPLLRVLLTGYLFLKQKDRAMGLVAFGVLIVLLASFVLGIEV